MDNESQNINPKYSLRRILAETLSPDFVSKLADLFETALPILGKTFTKRLGGTINRETKKREGGEKKKVTWWVCSASHVETARQFESLCISLDAIEVITPFWWKEIPHPHPGWSGNISSGPRLVKNWGFKYKVIDPELYTALEAVVNGWHNGADIPKINLDQSTQTISYENNMWLNTYNSGYWIDHFNESGMHPEQGRR